MNIEENKITNEHIIMSLNISHTRIDELDKKISEFEEKLRKNQIDMPVEFKELFEKHKFDLYED